MRDKGTEDRKLEETDPALTPEEWEPILDTLLGGFRDLEEQVRQRARRARQARCPHENTIAVRAIGVLDRDICRDCGLSLPREK